jgi:hypothetical protein
MTKKGKDDDFTKALSSRSRNSPPIPILGGEKTIFNTPVDLAFGRGKKEPAPNTIHSDVFSLLSPIFASAL